MSANYVPRVTQLDALHLDTELEELFKQQLFHATKFFEPGWLQPFLPELELLLRTWIFKYSVYDKKCTFGQQMLSLRYNTTNISKSKLYWYYGYSVGLRYLKERSIYSLTSNVKIQTFIQKLETFQMIGEVLNFLRFIKNGRHASLLDFILGLDLVADKLTREDLTDFSWTRELLWHNLIELLGTTFSLANKFGVSQKAASFISYYFTNQKRHHVKTKEPPIMKISTVCAFCSARPILPHTIGCPHFMCYYCVMANRLSSDEFHCPKCYYSGNEAKKYVMK